MNEQRISLDVAKESGTPQVVTIAQGDAAGTTIVADVYDNGAALDLTGKTARLVARLPDGLHYNRLPCTVGGSTATCVLGEDSLARVAGYTDCAYIEIQDGDAVVSTERFALDILRSALDGAEPGENWDSEIQRVIAQGDASIERVNAAIDSASVSDEDIDAVASGEDRSGSAKLSLSGLTRLWGHVKDAFAAKSHTHATDDVTSGVLPVERGGTGSSTGRAPSATKLATARELRTDLGSTDAASFDGSANATPGVTGTLDVAHGGTGSTTAVDARTALGAASASDLSDLQDSVSHTTTNTLTTGVTLCVAGHVAIVYVNKTGIELSGIWSYAHIATLPSGYTPVREITVPVVASAEPDCVLTLGIKTDGIINVYQWSAASHRSANTICGHAVFVLA